MKADSLIFRRLSQADFKNISGQGGVEGGVIEPPKPPQHLL